MLRCLRSLSSSRWMSVVNCSPSQRQAGALGSCWGLLSTSSRQPCSAELSESESADGLKIASGLPPRTRQAVLKARARLIERYREKVYAKPLRCAHVKRVHLPSVFVPPLLTNKSRILQTKVSGQSTQADLVETSDRARPEEFHITDVFHQRIPLARSHGDYSSVLVLGPPGSGKSTCFGRMLPYYWACSTSGEHSSDFLANVWLCFVLKIRTFRGVDLTKAVTLDELFQLQGLGLGKDDVEEVCEFLKTNRDQDRVLVIVDGLDKRNLPKDSYIQQLIERALPMCKYRLLVSARPCRAAHDFLNEGSFNRVLHLGGFSPEQRTQFLTNYVMYRHRLDWISTYQKHQRLLQAADQLCELLARLPFIATLVAELLPTLSNDHLVRTKTEFFRHLIGQLVTKDFSPQDKITAGGDLDALPNEYHLALKILGDLALDGLFCDLPRRGFTARELWQAVETNTEVNIKSEMERLLHALTEHFQESQAAFMLKESYQFLDSSVQEFVAAYAVSKKNDWVPPQTWTSTDNMDRLENFWVFAAGLSSPEKKDSLFVRFMAPYGSKGPPLIKETLLIMLEEAFPGDCDHSAHKDLLDKISEFLQRHVYFARRWAVQERPFECVGHALRVLPNIRCVSIYSQSDPSRKALQTLMGGLHLHTSTLRKVELLSMNKKATQIASQSVMAKELSELLRDCHALRAFHCHWSLPVDCVELLCSQGVAHCKTLVDFGLSFFNCQSAGDSKVQTIADFIMHHPSLISLTFANLNRAIPRQMTDLISHRDSKLEHVTFDLASAQAAVLSSITQTLVPNRSLTSIAFTTSDHHLEETLLPRQNGQGDHLLDLARVLRKHPEINRVVLQTYALLLDDRSMISMMEELLINDSQTKMPILYLHVACHEGISPDGGRLLDEVVAQSKLKVITSSRQYRSHGQILEKPGTFRGDFPPWEPKRNLWPWLILATVVSISMILALVSDQERRRLRCSSSSVYSELQQETELRLDSGASTTSGESSLLISEQTDTTDIQPLPPFAVQSNNGGAVEVNPMTTRGHVLPLLTALIIMSVPALGYMLQKTVEWIGRCIGSVTVQQQEEEQGRYMELSVDRETTDHSGNSSPSDEENADGDSDSGRSVIPSARSGSGSSAALLPELEPLSSGSIAVGDSPNMPDAKPLAQSDFQHSLMNATAKGTLETQQKDSIKKSSKGDQTIHREETTQDSAVAQPLNTSYMLLNCNKQELQKEEMDLFNGPKADTHMVKQRALQSPLLEIVRPYLSFFIQQLKIEEVLDHLIEQKVFKDGPQSDDYQQITHANLIDNERRRLLLHYALGAWSFKDFAKFFTAVEELHRDSHPKLILALKDRLHQSSEELAKKCCTSLQQPHLRRFTHILIAQDGVEQTAVTAAARWQASDPAEHLQDWVAWHKEDSSTYPHLLQALHDSDLLIHPSDTASSDDRLMVTHHQ